MEGIYSESRFQVNGKILEGDFKLALRECGGKLTLDWAALTSYFTYGFVSGNRTLFNEIKRIPWMSTVEKSSIRQLKVPEHRLNSIDIQRTGDRLYVLLREEVVRACARHKHVYILLSGGLDSRILAGIVAELDREGFFEIRPKAFTWGAIDSRDVYLAKKTAEILRLDWEHVQLNAQSVLRNIRESPLRLGLIHSPELLHSFLDIEDKIEDSSIILAGSYGDSIGRGEFMGKHLLNLNINLEIDKYDILKKEVSELGREGLEQDLECLLSRVPNDYPWAKNEVFMQAYRMRNGLAHALTSFKSDSTTYQIFTSSKVIDLIWSIHPSHRDDRLYEYILKNKLPQLGQLEWARTLKSVDGKFTSNFPKLRKDYHEYTKWSAEELWSEIANLVDHEWFNSKGIFNKHGIYALSRVIRKAKVRNGRLNEFWLYLAGFRILIDELESEGYIINYGLDRLRGQNNCRSKDSLSIRTYFVAYLLSHYPALNGFLKKVRAIKMKRYQTRLKASALIRYPVNCEK